MLTSAHGLMNDTFYVYKITIFYTHDGFSQTILYKPHSEFYKFTVQERYLLRSLNLA